MWHGSIGSIPTGWVLCDGTLGTPDMRDRFVQGAGGALNLDDTGGAENHDHPFTGDMHTHLVATSHDCPGGGGISAWSAGADGNETLSEAATGTTDSVSGVPPFIALVFIKRIA
jgi:microcystin-dependent protein